MALVHGFGGMRDRKGELSFRPRLPGRMSRLSFKVQVKGSTLRLDITATQAIYHLESGEDLTVVHEGESLHLKRDVPVSRPLGFAHIQTTTGRAAG